MSLKATRASVRALAQDHQVTDSKIESTKELQASGIPSKDATKNIGVSNPTLCFMFAGLAVTGAAKVSCNLFANKKQVVCSAFSDNMRSVVFRLWLLRV